MRNTQPVPTCPQCGQRVYRTHTCRVSGLRKHHAEQLPERGEQLPAARPLQLVPMPEGWRDQVADELAAHWPARAQLELVTDLELDYGDEPAAGELGLGPEAGRLSLDALLGTLLVLVAVAVPTIADLVVAR